MSQQFFVAIVKSGKVNRKSDIDDVCAAMAAADPFFAEDDDTGRRAPFAVLELEHSHPEPEFEMFRLSHLHALVVCRDDYDAGPNLELTDVIDLMKRTKSQDNDNGVEIKVLAHSNDSAVCSLCQLAGLEPGSPTRAFQDELKTSLLSAQSRLSAPINDDLLVRDVLLAAFLSGWTAPDGKSVALVKKELPEFQDEARTRVVKRWVQEHPALAESCLEDALGFLIARASRGEIQSTDDLLPRYIQMSAGQEERAGAFLGIRSLSWAIRLADITVGSLTREDRARLVEALYPDSEQVVLLWPDDNGDVRQGLHGLLSRWVVVGEDTDSTDHLLPKGDSLPRDLMKERAADARGSIEEPPRLTINTMGPAQEVPVSLVQEILAATKGGHRNLFPFVLCKDAVANVVADLKKQGITCVCPAHMPELRTTLANVSVELAKLG